MHHRDPATFEPIRRAIDLIDLTYRACAEREEDLALADTSSRGPSHVQRRLTWRYRPGFRYCLPGHQSVYSIRLRWAFFHPLACDDASELDSLATPHAPGRHDMLSEVITVRNAWEGLLPPFLFALCGVLGAALFLAEIKADSDWIYIVPALPFGIACAFLCLRPLLLAIAAAAIYCLIWAAAFYIAAYLCGKDVNQYLAMLLAGLIGGVGVAGLSSLDAPRLRTLPSLAAAGVIGAVFALPFALYAKPSDFIPFSEETVVRVSFALWQAAVGTYVYRICTGSRATSSAA